MLQSRIAYSALMVIAAVLATWLVRRHQTNLSLAKGERWTMLASAFVGATFAAKLPFLFQASESHSALSAWFGDGKTLLWGLAGGYAGVEIGKWMMQIKTRTGDSFVIGVAMASAVGRIGCLLFGCCYGTPTQLPWGVCFPMAIDGGTIARHPTQLYESLFHLSFASLAAVGLGRGIWRGQWMPLYLLCYCVYRFLSEYLRPEPRLLGTLTFYQYSSLVIGVAMGLILWARRRPTHLTNCSTRD